MACDVRKWEEKSLVWKPQTLFTYHMNWRLIKLGLKSSTCEIIYFPLIVPCFLPQISIEVPFAVIINTSQWHCQLFLICHLLLVSARFRILADVTPVCHVCCKKSSVVWRTILIHKFSIRMQKTLQEATLCPCMLYI